MEAKSPEARERRPLRKAREESQARMQALAAEKVATFKTTAKGSENVAPKKRAKDDKKEEAAKVETKKGKAAVPVKSNVASSSKTAVKEAEKKKTVGAKSKAKSKTDDDVVKEKPVPVALKRRSRSLDSRSASEVTKKKPTKRAAIAELAEPPALPAKRARVKKADVVEPQPKPKASKKAALPPVNEVDEEVPKKTTKRAAATAKTTDKVPVKKMRGGKTAAKPAELERSEEEDAPAPAKKSRVVKKPMAKTTATKQSPESSGDESSEEEEAPAPAKKPQAVKKPVAKKAVKQPSTEASGDEEVFEDEVPEAAKKSRAVKKPMAKTTATQPSPESSEDESPEEDKAPAPAQKSRAVQKPVAKQPSTELSGDDISEDERQESAKASPEVDQNDTLPIGRDESSESDEEMPSAPPSKKPIKQLNNVKEAKSIFDTDNEEPEEPKAAEKGSSNESADFGETQSEGESEEPVDQPSNSRKTKAAPASSVPEKKARGKAQKQIPSDDGDDDKPTTSKGGKKLQNKVDTDYREMDFDIAEKFNMKIVTWNVAGLKALAKKNVDYFEKENADIICLNELKCTDEADVPDVFKLDGYSCHWNIAKGSGGVAVLSKVKPLHVTFDLEDTEFADAHRLITVEYEKFFLVSTYVVNSSRGLKNLDSRLEWNKAFDAHILTLDKKKPVVIAGDMNVSHQEIDLANPKTNKKNAGFTQEERDGFSELLSHGFIDTYRHFHPEEIGAYTFWTYMNNARAKNVGWRLDYFLVSKRFIKNVKANIIRSKVLGSDHCPIALFLNL